MSDESSTLEVLTCHLSKVKLQAEEDAYRCEREIRDLKRQVKQEKDKNSFYQLTVEEQESEIHQLRLENTTKWRIEERDDWKALVKAVQEDRKRLQEENEKLVDRMMVLEMKSAGSDSVACTRSISPKPSSLPQCVNRRERDLYAESLSPSSSPISPPISPHISPSTVSDVGELERLRIVIKNKNMQVRSMTDRIQMLENEVKELTEMSKEEMKHRKEREEVSKYFEEKWKTEQLELSHRLRLKECEVQKLKGQIAAMEEKARQVAAATSPSPYGDVPMLKPLGSPSHRVVSLHQSIVLPPPKRFSATDFLYQSLRTLWFIPVKRDKKYANNAVIQV